MSTKFNGFSQEDINKLSAKSKKLQVGARGIRRVVEKKTETRKEPDKAVIKEPLKNDSPDSSMSSLQEAVHFRPLSTKIESKEVPSDESILHVDKSEEKIKTINGGSPFKGVSLKDFESQRKMIEEQNKQKKDLLYKAIEHHSQKTAAEIRKIQEIKEELSKLDTDLAADVAILRKEIEAATLNYSNIQKNYQRVESQFLKAKLELYQACEKKELLTEHLCTVISHNEDRKAKKLSELMDKVGLSPTGEIEVPENEILK